MSGWTGLTVYEGSGGRSYNAEALNIGIDMLASIVDVEIGMLKQLIVVQQEGMEGWKSCCSKKEGGLKRFDLLWE